MDSRSISLISCGLSLVLIVVGYILSNPNSFGLCVGNGGGCISQNTLFGIGFPLFQAIYLLPVLFFVLAFVRREVFNTWWKVALPVGIVFLVVIFVTPPLGENISADRTTVTAALVKIFVFVSAIVIAWKYWRLRSGRKIVG